MMKTMIGMERPDSIMFMLIDLQCIIMSFDRKPFYWKVEFDTERLFLICRIVDQRQFENRCK